MKHTTLGLLALAVCGGLAACSGSGESGTTPEGAAGASGSAGSGGENGGESGSGGQGGGGSEGPSYAIVDSSQDGCYDDRNETSCPGEGEAFFGQDSQYSGAQPSYTDNGDGTITDHVTGLMWQQAMVEKVTWDDAIAGAAASTLGGHSDWRMPSIKELYSLMDFNGGQRAAVDDSIPYLDTDYFDFVYGDESAGERLIDSQNWSATEYIGTTMNGDATVFGVNFADGRIKGYPKMNPQSGFTEGQKMYARFVRGNGAYGINDFVDNGDGTVTDRATGLTWQQGDSVDTLNWQEALDYAEGLELAGHDDWRLPNAKELQSILDYTRAPTVTGEAAIDPVFDVTEIESYFWTGTSHLEHGAGDAAVYLCFGRGLGYIQPPQGGDYKLLDVHGAGAQRSDPKDGDPADYPNGRGPQGDDIRIFNFVRVVRGG